MTAGHTRRQTKIRDLVVSWSPLRDTNEFNHEQHAQRHSCAQTSSAIALNVQQMQQPPQAPQQQQQHQQQQQQQGFAMGIGGGGMFNNALGIGQVQQGVQQGGGQSSGGMGLGLNNGMGVSENKCRVRHTSVLLATSW